MNPIADFYGFVTSNVITPNNLKIASGAFVAGGLYFFYKSYTLLRDLDKRNDSSKPSELEKFVS